MTWVSKERQTFTPAEADEIRNLLANCQYSRRASQRIAMARLRRMGLGIADGPGGVPTLERFEHLLGVGELTIDRGVAATLQPQLSNVFRVAVGVAGWPVPETWSAFDQRYQWFGKALQSITSGSYLFVLAVDRWKSAVVGLYEAVSPGAARLPGSPDPERWPWAVGVRPLAAIPPPLAERVDGQIGPQSGLPSSVRDPDALERMYRAVSASPPPPGPTNTEQRVQELEWRDVAPDVLEAVTSLGGEARGPEIVSRAIELGEWSEQELAARAWYTGSGVDSHVGHVLGQVLLFEQGANGALRQVHGRYSLTEEITRGGFGVVYRPAAEGQPPKEDELPTHLVDLSELDRATERHMSLQDRLADVLRGRGIEPRSPASWQPKFDLGFEHEGRQFVVEVKSGEPVSMQQARLGAGQVLEYRHLLADNGASQVEGVLLFEAAPPYPWPALAKALGLKLLRADQIAQSVSAMLDDDA